MTEILVTCPSGECEGVEIHTREAYRECELLEALMDTPMPREVNPYDTPGAWMDSTWPNEY